MYRTMLSTAAVIVLLLMGTACTGADTSGAAEVVEQIEDEAVAGSSESPPEPPAEDPSTPAEDPSTGGSSDSTADALPGGTLEGAPVPNDAQTGQLNTTYTDTVLRSETNWYRFDVPPGTEVQGQLTIAPNPESGGGAFCPYIYLADAGDSHPAYGSGDGNPSTEAIIAQTDPAVIDANEIYLKIQTDNCLTTLEDPATYEIELQLNTMNPA
jgi:hypothetical protein